MDSAKPERVTKVRCAPKTAPCPDCGRRASVFRIDPGAGEMPGILALKQAKIPGPGGTSPVSTEGGSSPFCSAGSSMA